MTVSNSISVKPFGSDRRQRWCIKQRILIRSISLTARIPIGHANIHHAMDLSKGLAAGSAWELTLVRVSRSILGTYERKSPACIILLPKPN
jgi:hypothetical protein